MKAFVDCFPCFLQQAVQTGRLCGLSEDEIKHVLDVLGKQIEQIPLEESPPLMAAKLQRIVSDMVGTDDPFKEIKEMGNKAASAYYEEVMALIGQSDVPLKTALQAAIAGNIIDYGAVHDLDVHTELTMLMDRQRMQVDREDSTLFAYDRFVKNLSEARSLLYIGDNAGEIVFDKALIATIKQLYPQLDITFATRGKPILNDVLLEDARQIGLDKLIRVVSSGVDTPGAVLERASSEFRSLFDKADLIISKGQGNFESLTDVKAPIYFLLVAKCQPVANLIGCDVRDIILKRQD